MAKYVEKKEPLVVDIEFYSSKKGHVAVIPHTMQDDPRVGMLNTGVSLEDYERAVYEGDAIIYWGRDKSGDKYSVMRADAVDAFFAPYVPSPPPIAAPALSETSSAETIEETVVEG